MKMAYQRNMYYNNEYSNSVSNTSNPIPYINVSKVNDYSNIPSNQYSTSCPQGNIAFSTQQKLCMGSSTSQLQPKQNYQPNSFNMNNMNNMNRNRQSFIISNKITPSSTNTYSILSMSNQSSYGQVHRPQMTQQPQPQPQPSQPSQQSQQSQQSQSQQQQQQHQQPSMNCQNNGFSTITPSPELDNSSVLPLLPTFNTNNTSNTANSNLSFSSNSNYSTMEQQQYQQQQQQQQKQQQQQQQQRQQHQKQQQQQQRKNNTKPPSQQHQQQQTWGPFLVEEDNELINVDEYVDDILEYMKTQELYTLPEANYMAYQNEINNNIRRILIEWLIEVHGVYDLKPETLYLTVNLIDRYLSKRIVPKSDFQLLGVTALWVAAKYEEAHGKIPSLNQMKFICCKFYEETEFIQMEMRLLEEMNFSIGHPTPEAFLKLNILISPYERTTKPAIKALARYIMEISLVDYSFIRFTPSVIAQSSIVLAVNILNQKSWIYIDDDLWSCVRALIEKIFDPPKSVHKKYSSQKYMKTSIIAEHLILSNPKFKNLSSQKFDSNMSPISLSTLTSTTQILSSSNPLTSYNSSDQNSNKNNALTTTFTIITTSMSPSNNPNNLDLENPYNNDFSTNNPMPTPPKESMINNSSMILDQVTSSSNQNMSTTTTSSSMINPISNTLSKALSSSMSNNQWLNQINTINNSVNSMNTLNSTMNSLNNNVNNINMSTMTTMGGMNGMTDMNNTNSINNIYTTASRNSRNSLNGINSIKSINSRNLNNVNDISCIKTNNNNDLSASNIMNNLSTINKLNNVNNLNVNIMCNLNQVAKLSSTSSMDTSSCLSNSINSIVKREIIDNSVVKREVMDNSIVKREIIDNSMQTKSSNRIYSKYLNNCK